MLLAEAAQCGVRNNAWWRPFSIRRNPITGIAACCARAARGHAAAARPKFAA